jgi:hypothetical protein
LQPFRGIGDIVNERSSLKEIIKTLGEAEINENDERENRILEYPDLGLSFKFLMIFNIDRMNPIVSFITIRKPFVDESKFGLSPGIPRKKVYEIFKDYSTYDKNDREETWIDKFDRKMKCSYDLENNLESIVIF